MRRWEPGDIRIVELDRARIRREQKLKHDRFLGCRFTLVPGALQSTKPLSLDATWLTRFVAGVFSLIIMAGT